MIFSIFDKKKFLLQIRDSTELSRVEFYWIELSWSE